MKNQFEIFLDYFLPVLEAIKYFNNDRTEITDDEYQYMEISEKGYFADRRDRTSVALGIKKIVSTQDLERFRDVVKIEDVIKYMKREISLRDGSNKYMYVKDILMVELRRIIIPFCDIDFLNRLNYCDKNPRKSKAEQYLVNCITLIYDFKLPFEKMCFEYDVNLAKIQKELNFTYIEVLPIEKFPIDENFISKIYDHSNGEIFRCSTVDDFYKMIEAADFSKLEITVISKTKKLIHHLSEFMPSDWYKKIANSKGWKPRDCSGATVEKSNIWMVKLKKIKPKAL